MELLADLVGFTGSLLLLFPALRVTELLRQQHRVTQTAKAGSGDNALLGHALVTILEGYIKKWNPRDYVALMLGMICLSVSFLLSLLSHIH